MQRQMCIRDRSYLDNCSHLIIIHAPRTSTKKKRERKEHTNPHTHTRDLYCGPTTLSSTLSLQVEGRRTPSITVQNLEASDYFGRHPMTYIRCLVARHSGPCLRLHHQFRIVVRFGLRPPRSYPSTRTIILKGHPMSHSEANSFQFTWGEPTRGVCGLHSVNTSDFVSVRFLSMSNSTIRKGVCQEKNASN